MEKKQYIVPTLTVVEFKVERGYGASDPTHEFTLLGLFDFSSPEEGYNAQNQEDWNDNGQSIFSW